MYTTVQVRSEFGKFAYTAICMRKCTLWSDNTCVFTRFHCVKNANTQLIWCSVHHLILTLIWNRHGHECSHIWKLSGNFTLIQCIKKCRDFFGPRYIGDDFFLGPNLVSFNRAVVPYEISKVNFRVETKSQYVRRDLICECQRALYGIKCVLRIFWQTWMHKFFFDAL